MVKGTLRKRARDWASSVFPEPVGPTRRMFDFWSSTSSAPGRLWPGRCGAGRLARVDALVVIVDRDRKDLLGLVLPDHVVVEEALDLGRRRQRDRRAALVPVRLLGDDVVAEPDALVADVDRRPRDQLAHLALPLAAEGAGEIPAVVVLFPTQARSLIELDATSNRALSPPRGPARNIARSPRDCPTSFRSGAPHGSSPRRRVPRSPARRRGYPSTRDSISPARSAARRATAFGMDASSRRPAPAAAPPRPAGTGVRPRACPVAAEGARTARSACGSWPQRWGAVRAPRPGAPATLPGREPPGRLGARQHLDDLEGRGPRLTTVPGQIGLVPLQEADSSE